MNKYSKIIALFAAASLLNACNEKTTRVIVDRSAVEDVVMRNDSVDIRSVNRRIKNGDVVITTFWYDMLKKRKSNAAYRVIAGPNDNVRIDSDAVYVNGKLLLRPNENPRGVLISMDSSINPKGTIAFRIPSKGERVNDSFRLRLMGTNNIKATYDVIKTKYYFLFNDDFTAIDDSRSFGLVPIDSIIGVVKKVYHKK